MPPPLPWFPPGVFRVPRLIASPAPAAALGRFGLEAELNGRGNGWTDISADLLLDPALAIDFGISSTGPTARTADSGEMTFTLANGAWNSAGLEGYYSPGHPNCRPGWRVGIRIRFTITINGVAYRQHLGWLEEIEPLPGRFLSRKVLCTSLDWINQAAKSNPTIATQANRASGLVVAAVQAAVPQLPEATQIDAGDSTFAFALDNSNNESSTALSELDDCAQSEPGYIYVKGDGTLRSEASSARSAPTSVATFNESMQGLRVVHSLNQLRNKVKRTTHPRRVDSGTSVLATNQVTATAARPIIAPGETKRFTLYYTDPNNRSQRCGGTGIISPVSGTDFTANTAQDGSGTNLTASFTVRIVGVAGANSVDLDVTNGSGSSGYLTLLQIRGSYVLDYDPFESVAVDAASIALNGETRAIIDMPYQSDAAVAAAAADSDLAVWGSPRANEVELEYVPPDDTTLQTALAIEPGSPITIVEPVTGVNAIYFVQHVARRFNTQRHAVFNWLCQLAPGFPAVRSRNKSTQPADVTNHTVALPSGIQAGDLLIAAFSVDCQPAFAAPVVTWPAGWTRFSSVVYTLFGLPVGYCELAWRKADGTEGASITVTTDVAQESTHITYRIAGAADPTVKPPTASTAFNVIPGALEMDPPRHTVADLRSYLWLAIASWYNPSPNAFQSNFSVIPASYANAQCQPSTAAGSAGVSVGGAERLARITSDDPSGFRIATVVAEDSKPYGCFTVNIPPAAAY